MKCITIRQPWASLIAMGWKTVETRTHTRFAALARASERIGIHAGLVYDETAQAQLEMIGRSAFGVYPNVRAARAFLWGHPAFPLGKVLCTAMPYLARRLNIEHSPMALCEATGKEGLFLKDVELVMPPAVARGHQGVWEWDPEREEVRKWWD